MSSLRLVQTTLVLCVLLTAIGFRIAAAVLSDSQTSSGSVNAAPDPDFDAVPSTTEGPCGSDALDTASVPERIDGPFAGMDDDGDGSTDEALPPGSEAHDCDGDGFTGNLELYVFAAANTVSDQKRCGADAWPVDFNDDTFVTGFDLQAVASVIGQNVPPAPVRRDITQDGAVTGADLSAVARLIGRVCG